MVEKRVPLSPAKKRKGFIVVSPVMEFHDRLGADYSQKLANLYPRNSMRQRANLILVRLGKISPRYRDMIRYRVGLDPEVCGRKYSLGEIALANKVSRVTIHTWERNAFDFLKKHIDDLLSQPRRNKR